MTLGSSVSHCTARALKEQLTMKSQQPMLARGQQRLPGLLRPTPPCQKWPLTAASHKHSVLPSTAAALPASAACMLSAWPTRGGMLQHKPQTWHRRDRVLCGSMASMVQDPADVIPNPDDSDDDDEDKTPTSEIPVLVVGAGSVGIITAMYLARRGYNVQVVDKQVHPANRPTAGDVPLVLSSRVLMAFEELGAKELLSSLASTNLKGRWHWSGARQPSLEAYTGHDQRYTRRVLVGNRQLELALLEEAERLFPGKISFFYQWEFERIDWDNRRAMVVCHNSAGAEQGEDKTVDPLLPELANTPSGPDAMWVPYGLLVGADGPDSLVREQVGKKRPKITDFDVQRPLQDLRQAKTFTGIPVVPGCSSALPEMSSHQPRVYEYSYGASGAPSIRMWMTEPGQLQGVVMGLVDSWNGSTLDKQLQQAYGEGLPAAWRQAIISQTCGADAPEPISWAKNVQCSQFHGPRVALVGGAAHHMTGEYDQAFNCAVEGIRLLNLALKSTKDGLDRALPLYSEVRCEDAHSMQQLEFFKRSSEPGLKHADTVYWLASAVAALVWRSALMMMSIVRSWMPERFPATYITDHLWDARRGYNDLLKVVIRFAAAPLACVLGLILVGLRVAWDMKTAGA